MGTMAAWNDSVRSRQPTSAGQRRGARPVRPGRGSPSAASVVVGVAALFASTGAVAQKWTAEVGVSSRVEWTSNAQLGEAGGRGDVILDVRPQVRLTGEGGQFKVSGTAALDGVNYLHKTQPSRIRPEADLTASLQAVPRLVFLDAGLRVFQTSANPFGARQETGSSKNSETTVVGRVSPRIEGMAGEHLRYVVRSDNVWTNQSGATAPQTGTNSSGYFGQNAASIEHDPLPFGWRLAAERTDTTYRDGTVQPLVIELARATTLYALSTDITFGLYGGYEHTNFDTPGQRGWIYGIDAKWQPSSRTLLTAFGEHRFFGDAWRVAFAHRTPAFAWNIVSSRTLQTAPQSAFDLPATNNVAALLDGIFTTRYPDPVERARAVQNFISSQGLPTSTLQPITLQQRQLSIVNLNMATIALIGVRNTVSLSGFQSRTADATGGSVILSGGSLTNNSQIGGSIALTHKLTPSYTLTASSEWSRISALSASGADRTIQKSARLLMNVQAAPRTSAFAEVRYTRLDSNSAVSGREGAVFAGLDHRF